MWNNTENQQTPVTNFPEGTCTPVPDLIEFSLDVMNPVYCSLWRVRDILTIRHLCPGKAVAFTARPALCNGRTDAGRFFQARARS